MWNWSPRPNQLRKGVYFNSVYIYGSMLQGEIGVVGQKILMAIIIDHQKKMKITSTSSFLLLCDDIMVEVLARLPRKSLCISKSVCKSWLSIISHPEFIKSYTNQWKSRSSRFFLSIHDGHGLSSYQRYLLGTVKEAKNNNNNLDFEEWLSMPHKKRYFGVTQVINGLVCFYVGCHVCLCNLSTGEMMRLPVSHDNDHIHSCNARNFRYFFGFDPISRAYKLLRVHYYRGECKILTLAGKEEDMSWKSIKGGKGFPLAFTIKLEAFCIDGSLHWMQGNIGVASFDLNQHCFGSYLIPDVLKLSGVVLQFRGRLALAYNRSTESSSHLKIVSFNGRTMSYHSFELPIQNLIPFSSLSTGEIMLVNAEFCDRCIYSYDPESQKFERFVVGKFPPLNKSKMDSSARISCFEANFNPLSLILNRNSGL